MNRSKRKGSSWERDVAAYLAARLDLPVERRVTEGKNDRGDIAGIPNWVIECKATKQIDLAAAMNEAKKEAATAAAPFYAAVIKRRNYPVDSAYAIVPLWLLADIMEATSR